MSWIFVDKEKESQGQMRDNMRRSMQSVLRENNIELPNEMIYTSWYLFNMAIADYPETLKTDEQRAMFVKETLCDPDGMPENTLDCFVAKMCNAGIPIYWELYA